MLTREQRVEFAERGLLRLRGVFSRRQAAAMEERLWSRLEAKHGIRRDDPAGWEIPLVTGLQSLRTHAVFDPIGGPALRQALDGLLGEARWTEPSHWGQLLVSFPVGDGGWRRSQLGWHTDFPYTLPTDRVVGALVFSFVGEVPPRTGGTLAIAGSHRVVGRFVEGHPHLRKVKMKVARQALMSSDPWLKSLCSESEERDWLRRFPDTRHVIGEIPVELVELTGEPGDVVVGHPWLVHASSPNRGERPRFMRVQRVGTRPRARGARPTPRAKHARAKATPWP